MFTFLIVAFGDLTDSYNLHNSLLWSTIGCAEVFLEMGWWLQQPQPQPQPEPQRINLSGSELRAAQLKKILDIHFGCE